MSFEHVSKDDCFIYKFTCFCTSPFLLILHHFAVSFVMIICWSTCSIEQMILFSMASLLIFSQHVCDIILFPYIHWPNQCNYLTIVSVVSFNDKLLSAIHRIGLHELVICIYQEESKLRIFFCKMILISSISKYLTSVLCALTYLLY